MTSPIRTHAEAQAILDFIARVLARADKSGGTVAYSIQEELDILTQEKGIKQPFERFLPGLVDEGMGHCGDDWEVVNL